MTSPRKGPSNDALPSRALACPPGRELRWGRVFPGRADQLGHLRRWLRGLLPAAPSRDDVVMVAVELATNAVTHTASGRGGCFVIEVRWLGSAVRVAVADQGAPTGPRPAGDLDSENGRGLLVVNRLSTRTGVSGDQRGRTVWAEVPWATDDAAARRPSPDAHEAAIGQDETVLSQCCAPARTGDPVLAPVLAGVRALARRVPRRPP